MGGAELSSEVIRLVQVTVLYSLPIHFNSVAHGTDCTLGKVKTKSSAPRLWGQPNAPWLSSRLAWAPTMRSLEDVRAEHQLLGVRVKDAIASANGFPLQNHQIRDGIAHQMLQRHLLSFLVNHGQDLKLPVRPEKIIAPLTQAAPSLRPIKYYVTVPHLERALHELRSVAPRGVYVDRGELRQLDARALGDFEASLLSDQLHRPAGLYDYQAQGSREKVTPNISSPPTDKKNASKREASGCTQDNETAISNDMELDGGGNENLQDILAKPTTKQTSGTQRFRFEGGTRLNEFCRFTTKEECAKMGKSPACDKIHFQKIIQNHTDVSLGDCSYLDTCHHMATCKYIHYEVDKSDALRIKEKHNSLHVPDAFVRHYESQFINCDIRTFPMQTLGKFTVIMADPPWDIHMELPYGTMSDDEMRRMDVPTLQDDGVIFLWVTGRATELGRECLDIWGYKFVQELLWVKTNQLNRIARSGRTGHWLNHSKEHCLIGIKGNPRINNNIDCDVVCAEVRETSRKPDEMYQLLERLAPGTRKLELFGRPHNVHKGWTTLGNQLGRSQVSEPWLREHLLREGVFEEADLAPLPPPPIDPVVVPWGGHPAPPPLGKR